MRPPAQECRTEKPLRSAAADGHRIATPTQPLRYPVVSSTRVAKDFPTLLLVVGPTLSGNEFFPCTSIKAVERAACLGLVFVHLLRDDSTWNDKIFGAAVSSEIYENVNVGWRIDFAGSFIPYNMPVYPGAP